LNSKAIVIQLKNKLGNKFPVSRLNAIKPPLKFLSHNLITAWTIFIKMWKLTQNRVMGIIPWILLLYFLIYFRGNSKFCQVSHKFWNDRTKEKNNPLNRIDIDNGIKVIKHVFAFGMFSCIPILRALLTTCNSLNLKWN